MKQGAKKMSGPTLGNPQKTIEVLQKYDFTFQKKFGQNFLIDTHVLDKIISAAHITKEDMVLEIGPGIGTMTQYLAEAAGKVIAVEIDKNLIPILSDTLSAKAGSSQTSGRRKWRKGNQSSCKSSILHNDAYHYGII